MASRKYESSLREQQQRDTRQRILEGAARITLLEVGRLTHTAVAQSAGVSERTVYRHFPTVDALHSAFAEFQEARFSRDHGEDFPIEELVSKYETWPERIAGTEAISQMLAETNEPPMVSKSRHKRYERLERTLRPLVPDATPMQLRQLVLTFGALLSPEVFRRGKLIFDIDPDDVTPGPAWALRVLIETLRNGDTPWT